MPNRDRGLKKEAEGNGSHSQLRSPYSKEAPLSLLDCGPVAAEVFFIDKSRCAK